MFWLQFVVSRAREAYDPNSEGPSRKLRLWPLSRSLPMRLPTLVVLIALSATSTFALAQSVPAAIFTDPPADAAHPAKLAVLHIPTHGVLINGIVYQPSGAGPHPTLVICHGFPGNEKNLDLAQAVRRAGWNAVTFNYRGSWGSPGAFRLAQNLDRKSTRLN